MISLVASGVATEMISPVTNWVAKMISPICKRGCN
jgi:hypothetical protein